ncbi:hypothetical protein V8F20_007320 [Naviculisporaceae sp. PSN 640]
MLHLRHPHCSIIIRTLMGICWLSAKSINIPLLRRAAAKSRAPSNHLKLQQQQRQQKQQRALLALQVEQQQQQYHQQQQRQQQQQQQRAKTSPCITTTAAAAATAANITMPFIGRSLKQCLPRNGMNWGVEGHVLARARRDRKVMQALAELGVRARPANVQVFFRELFEAATRFVVRHQLPEGMTLGGFCEVFGRTNAFARRLGSPVVFADLVEALTFARIRAVQRAVEAQGGAVAGIAQQYQTGAAPAPLALAIDAFVAAAPCVDWDSTRALVAADVDEDVTEVFWSEAEGAWRVVVQAPANDDAGMLFLAEGLNVMGVEAEEGEDEAVDDDIDGTAIDG